MRLNSQVSACNIGWKLLKLRKSRAIVNLSAETHVDRSIYGLEGCIQGKKPVLPFAAPLVWLSGCRKSGICFLHVTTDEEHGSLANDEPAFCEIHCHQPSNLFRQQSRKRTIMCTYTTFAYQAIKEDK